MPIVIVLKVNWFFCHDIRLPCSIVLCWQDSWLWCRNPQTSEPLLGVNCDHNYITEAFILIFLVHPVIWHAFVFGQYLYSQALLKTSYAPEFGSGHPRSQPVGRCGSVYPQDCFTLYLTLDLRFSNLLLSRMKTFERTAADGRSDEAKLRGETKDDRGLLLLWSCPTRAWACLSLGIRYDVNRRNRKSDTIYHLGPIGIIVLLE